MKKLLAGLLLTTCIGVMGTERVDLYPSHVLVKVIKKSNIQIPDWAKYHGSLTFILNSYGLEIDSVRKWQDRDKEITSCKLTFQRDFSKEDIVLRQRDSFLIKQKGLIANYDFKKPGSEPTVSSISFKSQMDRPPKEITISGLYCSKGDSENNINYDLVSEYAKSIGIEISFFNKH